VRGHPESSVSFDELAAPASEQASACRRSDLFTRTYVRPEETIRVIQASSSIVLGVQDGYASPELSKPNRRNVPQPRAAGCRPGFTQTGAYRRLALAIVLPFTHLSPTPTGVPLAARSAHYSRSRRARDIIARFQHPASQRSKRRT
jgi:hypothetical protein